MKLLLALYLLLLSTTMALDDVHVPSTTHFDVVVTLGGTDLIANVKPGDTGVSSSITFLDVNQAEYFPNDQEAYYLIRSSRGIKKVVPPEDNVTSA